MKELRLCKCGCRTVVKNDYIKGHNNKRKSTVLFTIEYRDYKSCCWVWQLGVNYGGYAKITRDGKSHVAHKYYWEKINGKVPNGLDLDRLCRVRNCIRPDHLEPVTVWENSIRGNVAKLTKEDIPKMIQLYKNGNSTVEIADIFNVGYLHVLEIL